MQYRRLGKWGVKVSEVALGSWLTYGGATADEAAIACVEKAWDLGINFFDTANVYARGKSEEVVGKALRPYRRDGYFLATKVFFPMGDGPNDRGLSRKHIFDQCHLSLRRLGTDIIDLYQCHRYDPETPLEETLLAMDDLIRQGKVLYWGVSQWSADQIQAAVDQCRLRGLHLPVSNQPLYNALHRELEKDVMPTCAREGLGQVVYSPLAPALSTTCSGRLAPMMTLDTSGRRRHQASASWLIEIPLADAMGSRVWILASNSWSSSPRPRNMFCCGSAARLPSGSVAPGLYLPVSNPCASGE